MTWSIQYIQYVQQLARLMHKNVRDVDVCRIPWRAIPPRGTLRLTSFKSPFIAYDSTFACIVKSNRYIGQPCLMPDRTLRSFDISPLKKNWAIGPSCKLHVMVTNVYEKPNCWSASDKLISVNRIIRFPRIKKDNSLTLHLRDCWLRGLRNQDHHQHYNCFAQLTSRYKALL